MNEWISVKDRLPRGPVRAVFADGKIIEEGIWYDALKQKWQQNSSMDFYGDYKGIVTHWMEYYPLTKPPEEDG